MRYYGTLNINYSITNENIKTEKGLKKSTQKYDAAAIYLAASKI